MPQRSSLVPWRDVLSFYRKQGKHWAVKRRDFITLLSAAAWPVVVRAQQGSAIRRIGVMSPLAADDAEWQARLAAFHQGLQESGWTIGRNIRVEYRLGLGDSEEVRRRVTELVALAPDAILVTGSTLLA